MFVVSSGPGVTLVNVNLELSPAVDIPVIALSTVIVPAPIATTFDPVVTAVPTVDATETTSPIAISKSISLD